VALRAERWEPAARLFAAAAALRARVGDVLLTTDELDDTQWVETLRAQLDDATFAAAWRSGGVALLEQLLIEARS
jgi:hypothetical protein